MRSSILRSLIALGAASTLIAGAVPAGADHARRPNTRNIDARGHSPQSGTFNVPDGQRTVNSDLAFWGDLAFNGNYDGWRVIDISDPDDPMELAHPSCNGDQGDIVVWEDILVRSWNSPKGEDRTCLDQTVPAGWEGVHVFDNSDPTAPDLAASVELPCGSHTVTVAGVSGSNLIVYSNNSSSFGCVDGTRTNDDPVGDFMDIISVPLADPSAATLLRREELSGPTMDIRTGCHDAAVILGDTKKAACASADTINVWDIGNSGGSLEDPQLLFTITEPGVGQGGRWHSAAFTWDGEVIVGGWEPGGGAQAECEATDDPVKKSLFFYDADTGAKLGQWVLPRVQTGHENCTVHNYNIVPVEGRYIAVSGNYQAGTWVTDFTDPTDPTTVAWSDPKSLGPGPFCSATNPPGCQLGGAWSSYWYNDFIYESDITRGLNVFLLLDPATAGALSLDHLNPQTQPFTLP